MNLDRLRKIAALMDSANPGEAAAARDRARVMLEKAGKTLADLPGILMGIDAPKQSGPFTFYDMDNPLHRAAWAEQDRQRREQEQRKYAPERAEVLARYGSEAAVLARTEWEEALIAAVQPWVKFQEPPYDPRWVKSIDGFSDSLFTEKAPKRVLEAIAGAYPLPTTISAAKAEYDAWERRDRDLGLVLEMYGDNALDLPAKIRSNMVLDLLKEGLRATSLGEVLLRHRFHVEQGWHDPDIDHAVLADLEALAGSQPPPPEAYRHFRDTERVTVFEKEIGFVQDNLALLREHEQAELRDLLKHRGFPPAALRQKAAYLAGIVQRRMEAQHA